MKFEEIEITSGRKLRIKNVNKREKGNQMEINKRNAAIGAKLVS